MMDPIKWKDEAFQAKTRAALSGRPAERGIPLRANSATSARPRKLALMLSRLTLRPRGALPWLDHGRSASSGMTAAPVAGCSCC